MSLEHGLFVMLRLIFALIVLLAVPGGVLAQSDTEAKERRDQGGAGAEFTVTERFGDIDKNKDGLINLYELASALSGGLLPDADADKTPKVDLEGPKEKQSTLAQIFLRADDDGDGSLSQLEYELYMQNRRQGNVDMPAVVPNIFEKRF